MSRRDERLPGGLERALHGGEPRLAPHDLLRAPDEWELVVSAVGLALLDDRRAAPPAHLGPKLARLLDPGRKPHPGPKPHP